MVSIIIYDKSCFNLEINGLSNYETIVSASISLKIYIYVYILIDLHKA